MFMCGKMRLKKKSVYMKGKDSGKKESYKKINKRESFPSWQ